MSYKSRLEVSEKIENNEFTSLIEEINSIYGTRIKVIRKLFLYQTKSNVPLDYKYFTTFYDPISQSINSSEYEIDKRFKYIIEVNYKPGVTDNVGHTASEALEIMGAKVQVFSGYLYLLDGNLTKTQADSIASEYFGNNLIQSIQTYDNISFNKLNRFNNISLPIVKITHDHEVHQINLDISDDKLIELSNKNCLALNLKEMQFIKSYFNNGDIENSRLQSGLPKWPTDVELEVIAQTWSEHCKHKIFAAKINYTGPTGEKKEINSLYKTYIKGSTNKIIKERNLDWAISLFNDNAGIVRFDPNIDLSIKAETHNSPSALDPYGGAITGILGVNRDILGTGMGHRPICNTNVFCFAPPNNVQYEDKNNIPVGLKHPRRIFNGVHQGVKDGGNKSGIPTVNGAIYFDNDYAGKPLVFCGTVGAISQKINGKITALKRINNNDRIVMVGGLIGADGVHGATFSSMELNESSPATAVQIGDPITQKRVHDFLLEALEKDLIAGVTDNGAGGLSSSVGEMAQITGGATIDIAKSPCKYPGLSPWEMVISESQERMTVAVSESKLNEFLDLSKNRNVISTDLGYFNKCGSFQIFFNTKLICDLNLEFLHDMLPKMELIAQHRSSNINPTWLNLSSNEIPSDDIMKNLKKLLSEPNITSKREWVKQYDHEVKAATITKPFGGDTQKGPNNSGVVWLHPFGGSIENAISIGCGIAPEISQYDSKKMAMFAVDEAVRNVVATGGDVDTCCLLDNFCWPDPVRSKSNPEGSYKLAQLVETCEGLYESTTIYGTPLVSGKDSMKNDFKGKMPSGGNVKISIKPTLLVTAMAKTNINYTPTSEFKENNNLVYLLGKSSDGLLGSTYQKLFKLNIEDHKLPSIDMKANLNLYRIIHKLCHKHIINSIHDISDGGLITAIAEKTFGNKIGANIKLEGNQDSIYNEAPGRFIVTISSNNKEKFEGELQNNEFKLIGETNNSDKLQIELNNKTYSETISNLLSAFERMN